MCILYCLMYIIYIYTLDVQKFNLKRSRHLKKNPPKTPKTKNKQKLGQRARRVEFTKGSNRGGVGSNSIADL